MLHRRVGAPSVVCDNTAGTFVSSMVSNLRFVKEVLPPRVSLCKAPLGQPHLGKMPLNRWNHTSLSLLVLVMLCSVETSSTHVTNYARFSPIGGAFDGIGSPYEPSVPSFSAEPHDDPLGPGSAWPANFAFNTWHRQEVYELRPRPRQLSSDQYTEGIGDLKMQVRDDFVAAPMLVNLTRNATSTTPSLLLTHTDFTARDAEPSLMAYLLPLGDADRLWNRRNLTPVLENGTVTSWFNSSLKYHTVTVAPSSSRYDGDRVIFFGGGENVDSGLENGTVSAEIFVWDVNNNTDGESIRVVGARNAAGEGQTPARMLHSAVFVPADGDGTKPCLYVFGGCRLKNGTDGEGIQLEMLYDVWRLEFEDDTLKRGTWHIDNDTATAVLQGHVGGVLPSLYLSTDSKQLIAYGGVVAHKSSKDTLQSSNYTCGLAVFTIASKSWSHLPTLQVDCDAFNTNVLLSGVVIPPVTAYLAQEQQLVVVVPSLTFSEVTIHLFNFFGKDEWKAIQTVRGAFNLPAINYGVTRLLTTWPTVSGRGNEFYLLATDTDGLKGFSVEVDTTENETRFVPAEPKKNFFGLANCALSSSSEVVPITPDNSKFLAIGLTCSDYHPQTAKRIGLFEVSKDQTTWTVQYHTDPSPHYGKPTTSSSPFTLNTIVPLEGYTNVVMNNWKTVVFYGGAPSGLEPIENELWCLNLNNFLWTITTLEVEAYPPLRTYHSAVAFNDSLMYVYGGYNATHTHSDLWVFRLLNADTCSGSWTELPSPGSPPRFGHSATLLNQTMYILGGASWNPANNISQTWGTVFAIGMDGTYQGIVLENRPSLNFAFHAAVRLGQIGIIAVGGVNFNVTGQFLLKPQNDQTNKSQPVYGSTSTYALIYPGEDLSEEERAHTIKIERDIPVSSKPPVLLYHQIAFDGDWLIFFGGFYWDSNTKTVLAIRPGCPDGRFSPNLVGHVCKNCSRGQYRRGNEQILHCHNCSKNTTTAENGSISSDSCTVCAQRNGHCFHHGRCIVQLPNTIYCDCDFGYWGKIDNCKVPYVGFLFIGSALIALVTVAFVWLTKQYKENKREAEERGRMLRSSRKELSRLAAMFNIDSSEIRLRKNLASGAFGEVWLAEYREMLVAVKRLKVVHVDIYMKEFEREGQMMRDIRHPNIILFLGIGREPNNRPFLVVEYMQRGTLEEVLGDLTINIDHIQQLRFAMDIAKGMRFLHSFEEPRIHRDLKSPNLLVSERWVVKVADLGATREMSGLQQRQQLRDRNSHWTATSREWDEASEGTPLIGHLQNESMLTRKVGSLLWSSPEMLADQPYGSSTDVYRCVCVCVCHNEKRGARRMASTTSDTGDTSSKQ